MWHLRYGTEQYRVITIILIGGVYGVGDLEIPNGKFQVKKVESV